MDDIGKSMMEEGLRASVLGARATAPGNGSPGMMQPRISEQLDTLIKNLTLHLDILKKIRESL